MFGTVRKHQTWLWAIIIAIVIVSFVVFFSPNVNLGMMDDSNRGTIKGARITSDQIADTYNEVRLLYWLQFQQWPSGINEMLESEVYNRLLVKAKIKEMNIKVSPEATARWIRTFFQSSGAQGPVAQQYQQFVDNVLKPQRLSAEDFERFARYQVAEEHLRSVFGLSGALVSRSEAEEIYKRENEQMQVDAVFFTASNYVDQVKVDDEALANYFNLHKPNYRIPDRIQVEYVRFERTNFFSAAEERFAADTNANLMLERIYFQRGGTNAFRDAEGNPLNVEEAKPQLKEEYIRQVAIQEASMRAAEFINAVDEFQQKNPDATNALAQVAAQQGLKVYETPLIDPTSDFEKLNIPFSFQRAAFALTPQNRFTTSPVTWDDGAYVLGLKRQVPGEIPPLEQIKDKVTADYKLAEALKLARNAGEAFQKEAAQGLAEGKSFESLLIAHKAKLVSLPPFSLVTRSMPELAGRLEFNRLQDAAVTLSVGQTSDFIPGENGGAVIYLRDRKPVDEQKMNAEIGDYINRIRQQRQYMAYVSWLNGLAREMDLRRPVPQSDSRS